MDDRLQCTVRKDRAAWRWYEEKQNRGKDGRMRSAPRTMPEAAHNGGINRWGENTFTASCHETSQNKGKGEGQEERLGERQSKGEGQLGTATYTERHSHNGIY